MWNLTIRHGCGGWTAFAGEIKVSAFPPSYVRNHLLALGCDPARVEETFTHSSGAGGQNVNKVATCVQLRYAPRNIVVKMQEHRTQAANRTAAWKLLATQLQGSRDREAAGRRAEREKKRRQKAVRPRWLKARLRDLKRVRAKKKSARQGVEEE